MIIGISIQFWFDSINWNRTDFIWNNRQFRLLSSTKEAVKYFMQNVNKQKKNVAKVKV